MNTTYHLQISQKFITLLGLAEKTSNSLIGCYLKS